MEALLDSQLTVLNAELEQSESEIKDILLAISSEVSTPGHWVEPQLALESLVCSKQLENSACHDTSREEVALLLKNLTEEVDNCGTEPLDVVEKLVHLAAECGLLLPFTCGALSGPGLEDDNYHTETSRLSDQDVLVSGGKVCDSNNASALSLNTVSDEVEQNNALAWNRLCQRLICRLVAQMSCMTAEHVLTQDETYVWSLC